MSDSGLDIWSSDGATLLFSLDIANFDINEQKSVEMIDIPGNIWNTAFDAVSITTTWTFHGTFTATDATWNTSTFAGRPLDFIHYLRSVLKSVYPIDSGGNYGGSFAGTDSDQTRACFILKINTFLGGTKYSYDINIFYTRPDGDATKTVRYVYQSGDLHYKGGEVLTVGYDLTFKEISDIIRLG